MPAGRGRLLVLALALLLLIPGAARAAAPSLDEALDQLERTYRRLVDLKAPFEQAAFNRTLGQNLEARGTLYWKKPGKLRWEYAAPTLQEIVSDGERLWVYTPELQQVNVVPAPEALTGPAGSFVQGLGQLRQHFHARFLNLVQPTDRDGLVVLDLRPKRPQPLLARLIVSVDPASWLVRKAVLYDETDNTVTVRFLEVTVNSGLADSLFTFVPPPGTAVVPAPGLGKP